MEKGACPPTTESRTYEFYRISSKSMLQVFPCLSLKEPNTDLLIFSIRSILPTTDKTAIVMSLIVKMGEKSKQDIPNF